MPTYEYRCEACGHELEAFQPMKDSPLTDCPFCKSPSLKRRISKGAGMIFKGSGFYETDYRRKGRPGEKVEAAAEGKASESKPAESESVGCAGGCACHGSK